MQIAIRELRKATKAGNQKEIDEFTARVADLKAKVGKGQDVAEALRARSIDVYQRAAAYARGRGIILADTKFEWGRLPNGDTILIDEVLTPDSSRFWPADGYRVGTSPASYDKQFVRDWLETTGWDKNSPPPSLPPEVVQRTREKYIEAYEKLTGDLLP